jgi:hypothetical protein
VVVGGGIAGVTTAAAALLHGANVALLEQAEELLHLQRGCHTRFLHPHIFEWPHPRARRAAAGLPILDWSVGTASNVATRIFADYRRIRLATASNRSERFTDQCCVRDVCLSDNGEAISWRKDDKLLNVEQPRAIILALGFGIEKTVRGLPRRSYWRVDSLTQTALDSEDDQFVIVVSGTGDGGVIDVLRARLREFDHGGFLDECVLRLGKNRFGKRSKKSRPTQELESKSTRQILRQRI